MAVRQIISMFEQLNIKGKSANRLTLVLMCAIINVSRTIHWLMPYARRRIYGLYV